jgi:hypothetical protein
MIIIRPTSQAEVEIWRLVRDVASMLRGPRWVLFGGMMIIALEAEADRLSPFATGDVDAL